MCSCGCCGRPTRWRLRINQAPSCKQKKKEAGQVILPPSSSPRSGEIRPAFFGGKPIGRSIPQRSGKCKCSVRCNSCGHSNAEKESCYGAFILYFKKSKYTWSNVSL